MGKPTGFLEIERLLPSRRPVDERLGDYSEIESASAPEETRAQAARCMSCGVPFCHTGCPLGNAIPDWNHHAYRDRFEAASASLHATNNFPEITGRICPAPCEEACVLNIEEVPVTIKRIEREIGDRALLEGWAAASPPLKPTGKTVAIVGSGPAGLACAQQLARAGHRVTVLERDDRIGGLLRYGIPDFKLEKHHVERRVAQMKEEGVVFKTGVTLGRDISIAELRASHDAVVVAIGATKARELAIPGRELDGVHLAMDYLTRQNQIVAGDDVQDPISAEGKRVVILGGGDTGSDCYGTALRQGARSVLQIELMPQPPTSRRDAAPWPSWPMILRTSSSQEEGGERDWAILTKSFEGEGGRLERLRAVRVTWSGREMKEMPENEVVLDVDLCLLALGFVDHELAGVDLSADTSQFATKCSGVVDEGVFSCGDSRRGQSLVVWAIWEGREAARAVDTFLTGATRLTSVPQHR